MNVINCTEKLDCPLQANGLTMWENTLLYQSEIIICIAANKVEKEIGT